MSESQNAEIEATTHQPTEVTSAEGMPFVRCSCDGARWQSAYWLREHWQGDESSGVAAIQAVVAQQADWRDKPHVHAGTDCSGGPDCPAREQRIPPAKEAPRG